MSVLVGLLLVLLGLAVMALGLFVFYALLPVFYAFFGLGLGLLLGHALTGEAGLIATGFGIAGAVVFAGAAHFLEPFRRMLLGVSGGALVGLAIASVFGLGGLPGLVFAAAGAVIGAVVVPMIFDPFIIVSSAFSGAAMVMTGAHAVLPGAGLFDRASGGVMPALITLVLAAAGIGWQYANLARWVQARPMIGAVSGASVRK